MDKEGIDPPTSRMLTVRSTIWATRPLVTVFHILGIEPTTFLQKKNALPLSYTPPT